MAFAGYNPPPPATATPIDFFKSLNASIKANFVNLQRPRSNRHTLLSKFQLAWDSIVVDCQTPSNYDKPVTHTDIVKSLQTMVDILVREEKAVTESGIETGGCTELFLNDDMLAQLVRMSDEDRPHGFKGEVIKFLSHLISVLDPKIIIQNAIHRPILTLIRSSLMNKSIKYEEQMLELEYDIAYKLDEYPQLLYILFSRTFIPKNVSVGSAAAGQVVAYASLGSLKDTLDVKDKDTRLTKSVSGDYEFLLFDHILRYITVEGHMGDFAREACLVIINLANGDLGDYISRTDFAVMAIAGLTGSFSQLPPRIPYGIAWGENQRGYSSRSSGGKRSAQEVFREDLESFIGLLEFVQAIILKCPSRSIASAVITEFKQTFLDNIVHSSLTSSSDFDGTTVAYMYYILQMLDSVKEDQLSALLSCFLLGGDDEEAGDANDEGKEETEGTAGKDADSPKSSKQDLELHIRDILISKLNSLSEEVVTVTLYVFQSLLANHSCHALPLLIERLPVTQKGIPPESKSLWDPASASALDQPVAIKTQSRFVPLISKDIHDHLSIVSRYFTLVPASDQFSEPPASRGLFGASAANPLPESVSLGAYLAEAENVIKRQESRHQRPRALPRAYAARTTSLQPTGESAPPVGVKSPSNPSAPQPDGSSGENVFALRSEMAGTGALRHKAELAGIEEMEGTGGLLSPGGTIREMMHDLSKDATLRKFLVKFANFFSHSFEINLALTGVITQLAGAPCPLLYLYLYSADILLGPTYSSLYSILIRLRREVEERRATIPNFDTALATAKAELFRPANEHGPASQRPPKLDVRSPTGRPLGAGELDLDAEFIKNVVILEEFVKEILSILVIHGSCDYDQVSYI